MPLSDDKHLTAAVKGIAMSIVNNISRLSTELKSFIEKSKIKTNLQTAIDNVKDIGNQFTDGDNGDDSNTDHGAKIDAALQKVSAAITQLEGLLGKMADDGGAIQEKIKEIETNLGELNNIWKDEQDGRIKKKQKDAEDLMLELQDEIKKLQSEIGAIGDPSPIPLREAEQAELTQLQSVVTEQLEKIEEIIREDKSTGVKGFLTILREGMFENFLSRSHPLKDGMKLSELAVQAVICFEGLFEYFDEELTPKNSRLVRTLHSQSTGPHAAMVENIRSVLNALLGHLINTNLKTYDFDHTFREKVHELTVSVGALSAKTFGEGRNPELLNIFKSGMSALTTELSHAYVNAYSGKHFVGDLVTKSTEQPTEQVLSTEGRNCAKVCLTILETVNSGLKGLRKGCIKSGSGMQINLSNGLGKAFQRLGYDVASSPTTQDGELRNKKGFTGENIYSDLLVYKHNTGKGDKTYQLVSDDDDNKEKKDKHGVIRQLNTHLGRYYYVSHYYIPPNPKSPSNIYHLLQWLLGLYFNPIYSTLGEYFKELFEKPENYKDKKYSEIDESQLSLLATTTIRPKTLKDTLRLVCLDSADTLIAFLGHGHPDGRYAVDFYTNTDGLSYLATPVNVLTCW
ncbi:hypothetical protein, conserved [Babesia ovata]|uniref:Extracellular matrix-binding ebh n=1 Tax=Babesia ovata TaxID=189622 RepID=A0A2H6KKL5_9APIC|nr:uncharacterized protein BOVATA_050110 [Babesia ovata]GBE63518.1 hypothetical protein, conserved [Babesia ovata]